MLDEDRGPQLVIIIWIFAFLASAVLCIKVWTRFKILHQSGIEDMFVFLAWVLSIIYSALLTASVHCGLGKHPVAISPADLSHAIELYTVSVPFGVLSVSLPTFAVAIVLHNISAPSPRQAWLLYTIPILHFLTKTHGGLEGFTAFTDIFLAVAPIFAFWKLQLKPKAKILLVLLFSSTTVAAACALVRIAYVSGLGALQDITYTSITHTIWVVIEVNVIIITACVPGLRPFVKHLRGKASRKPLAPPLQIQKESNQNSGASAQPSPVSTRRMEPRSSGSVSHGLQPLDHRASRLAQGTSKFSDVNLQAFEGWRGLDHDVWKAPEAGTDDHHADISSGKGVDGPEPGVIAEEVLVEESRTRSM
ncbi:MAG: hypothetical protein LQ345_003010 [Seirophora villosa]|nr:MAG: hypothetical protein LQ345_003010 [Seirophora villosa]